jgi:hypothetical protein
VKYTHVIGAVPTHEYSMTAHAFESGFIGSYFHGGLPLGLQTKRHGTRAHAFVPELRDGALFDAGVDGNRRGRRRYRQAEKSHSGEQEGREEFSKVKNRHIVSFAQ